MIIPFAYVVVAQLFITYIMPKTHTHTQLNRLKLNILHSGCLLIMAYVSVHLRFLRFMFNLLAFSHDLFFFLFFFLVHIYCWLSKNGNTVMIAEPGK